MTHETPHIDMARATPVPLARPCDAFYVRSGGKRAFDVIGASLALLVLWPVILVFWLLVRRDGGPGFYGQERVGRGGEIFRCWKLRSMCDEAETRLSEHLATDPAAALEWEATQKLAEDPRITRLGRFIRKFSIDELPQFWNVLRGEMSLIGPRPFMTSQADLYPVAGRSAYYGLRPGITGLWQISARNEETFASRAGYDVAYRDGLSFRSDLHIALETVRVMACGTGQ